MIKTLLIVMAVAACVQTQGQALKKYPIGNSGCSAYMLCNPGEFEMEADDAGTKVYYGQCVADSTTFGIVCVLLTAQLQVGKKAEEQLIAYLNTLKTDFKITQAAGYAKGQTLASNPNALGVLDYWKDETNNHWKIKGYTDGKIIAVLYTHQKNMLANTEKLDAFLNGFRFSN